MHTIELAEQESGDQLTEDIIQAELTALGEGAAECHVCGEKIREGDPVVAFVFRPADQSTFQLGHVKCIDCRHEPTEYVTLGVREIVVDGRVGTCTDHATQSSWPVLLAPQPRAVSRADTTAVHPLPGTAWFRLPIARSDTYTAVDRASTRKPWQRPVVRADTDDAENTLESKSELEPDVERPTDSVEPTKLQAPDGGRPGGAR